MLRRWWKRWQQQAREVGVRGRWIMGREDDKPSCEEVAGEIPGFSEVRWQPGALFTMVCGSGGEERMELRQLSDQ